MRLKSEALPINIPADEVHHLQTRFPYNWKTSAMKYLGGPILPRPSPPYTKQTPPPFRSIRELLKKWTTHHISLLGRVASEDDYSP